MTFRLLAPKAEVIMVEANQAGGGDIAMSRDDASVGSVTKPALQRELGAYTL